MMTNDPLREQLQRLAQALQSHDIKLIIGGGYGLLLRTEHIRRSGTPTRFAELPRVRSTEDIDIFLTVEVITDAKKFIKIRDTLHELGYVPVESAKFYQFVHPIEYVGLSRNVKIDLLAARVTGAKQSQIDQDNRRIKPLGVEGLHAHTTPEALTVEEYTLPINLGTEEIPLVVYLPHPFSYLILKLFALRDQIRKDKSREEKDTRAPYHAFDIYRTINMTFEEWEVARSIRDQYIKTEIVSQACDLVKELFSTIESPGMIQLRTHARNVGEEIPEKNLIDLLDDLRELLPSKEP